MNQSVPADYFLKVTEPDGTVHYYHIEAQTKNDNRMVFRMVEYGVRFALQHAAEAEKLVEGSRIVIEKTGFSDEKKEVLKKMTMFDKVGVGTDWIEIKRQKDEAVAQAERKAKLNAKLEAAQKALEMGLSPEQAAKLVDLPVDEIMALV